MAPVRHTMFSFRSDPTRRDQFARTPESLMIDLENRYGKFDFDPCPADRPDGFDGLTVPWGQNSYVNPPFKALGKWLAKACEEWKNGESGKQIVFLMPIRIHTEYFAQIVMPHISTGKIDCYVLTGGVKFGGYKERAPFGVMYLVFKPNENLSESDE